MKRPGKFVFLLLIVALAFSSCATISYPGKDGGLIANLEPKKYDMLGEVKIEGTTHIIMGVIGFGGATYNDLLQKAKKDLKADDVINVSLDKKNFVFLGVYISQTYIIRGVAIKYQN